MKKTLDLWAVLTLAISGQVLFIFYNILFKGSVSFTEPRLWVLIPETLIALFMFGMSFYVAWDILFRGKIINLAFYSKKYAIWI